jgi:NAD(P)-dependent dehydrogenase (short-subunit alcohol dehydrogenase family)
MSVHESFEGKVVLITGAATGIGRATSLAFARAGASLVLGDLNEQGANETVALVRELGGNAHFVRTDVSREADVAALVKHAIDTFGGLDCAFNNAGIAATPVLIHETPRSSSIGRSRLTSRASSCASSTNSPTWSAPGAAPSSTPPRWPD